MLYTILKIFNFKHWFINMKAWIYRLDIIVYILSFFNRLDK